MWAKGLLDVVYIDLTGSQSVQSASGFNYVMNIRAHSAAAAASHNKLTDATNGVIVPEV